mmetsp:Transcript_58895/g.97360  ORF Transcript_58895/g.97360 Transcript_58895/m.97360 type:complete len:356 (+) Transcript_58895:125-1192(+)
MTTSTDDVAAVEVKEEESLATLKSTFGKAKDEMFKGDHTIHMSAESLFHSIDKSDDGKLNLAEFKELFNVIVDSQKEAHTREVQKDAKIREERHLAVLFKKISILLGIALLITIGANAGLTAAVVYNAKDTKVTETVLVTKGGDAVRVGRAKVAVTATSLRSRRLKTNPANGRRRLVVAEVGCDTINSEWESFQTSGQTTGTVEVSNGVTTTVVNGVVIEYDTATGTVTVTSVEDPDDQFETNVGTSCTGEVYLGSRRMRALREPTPAEAEAHRRRLHGRTLEAGAVKFEHVRGCELYHCFKGDVDCGEPSAPSMCLLWDGDSCRQPACRLFDGAVAEGRRLGVDCETEDSRLLC